MSLTLFASNALAEGSVGCNGKSFTYNADGTVTVTTDWGDEYIYASWEEAYMDIYGFIPAKSWEEGGFDTYFNVNHSNNNSSNSNNSGSVKQRGRLIYTVKEATEVAKDTGNTVRIRYK